MFGQYSANFHGRLNKRDMVAAAAGIHGDKFITESANKVANNTLKFALRDGTQVYRLHATDVIKVAKNGSITLDSGGWRSVTTKDRMNAFLPSGWSVYSGKGTWMIRTPAGHYPYADGARFKADGTPLNPSKLFADEKRIARDKALVAKFLKKGANKGWADPAGDPWVFSQPCREVMLDWLRSGYFTARLCQLAFASRFGEAGVALTMSDMARNGGKLRERFHTSILRRYIYKSLGIA